MTAVVLDANAIIMHGRAFPDRARAAANTGTTLVVPESVREELVDDVLATEDAPTNHRESARDIQRLVDDGTLDVRHPDFKSYADHIDETRHRIADSDTPEHEVKADQYLPALVCDLVHDEPVQFVSADQKLRSIVRDLSEREGVEGAVTLHEPLTVL